MAKQTDNSLNQAISAVADGEATDIDLHRLLKATEGAGNNAQAARETWSRYHRIGAAIRREETPFGAMDISQSVMAEIAATPLPKVKGVAASWQALMGKTAVAATVAFGVVFGVQQYSTNHGLQEGGQLAAQPAAVVPQGFAAPEHNARTVGVNPNKIDVNLDAYRVESPQVRQGVDIDEQLLQQHLNRALYIHAQNASHNSAVGVMPFARTPSTDQSN